MEEEICARCEEEPVRKGGGILCKQCYVELAKVFGPGMHVVKDEEND